MNFNDQTPDYNYKKSYNRGRIFLLSVIVLSFLNIFGIFISNVYYLCSAYIPQIILFYGYAFYEETGDSVYLVTTGIFAAVTVIPYLICFILSKKHVGWLIGALALYIFDSLLFAVDFILTLLAGETGMIIDLVFRVIIFAYLIIGVKYGLKIANETQKEKNPYYSQNNYPQNQYDQNSNFQNPYEQNPYQQNFYQPDSYQQNNGQFNGFPQEGMSEENSDYNVQARNPNSPIQPHSDFFRQPLKEMNAFSVNDAKNINSGYDETTYTDSVRKITISRKKSFVGCAVPIIIVIGDRTVAKLKNGATETFDAPVGSFYFIAKLSSGYGEKRQIVDEGQSDLKFELSVKMSGFGSDIIITPIF